MWEQEVKERWRDTETIDRKEEMKRDTQTESFYTKWLSDKMIVRRREKVRDTEMKRDRYS